MYTLCKGKKGKSSEISKSGKAELTINYMILNWNVSVGKDGGEEKN